MHLIMSSAKCGPLGSCLHVLYMTLGITLDSHPANQTPHVYHCYQIHFGCESSQNLKCTKTTTKMRDLFCYNVEWIGLFKFMNYMLLSVIFSQIIVSFCNKVVQRMYTGNTSAFVFGVSLSSHVSWQRQFKLDLILLGTMSWGQLTSIEQWQRSLFPQCISLQYLKFPIMGYKPCLHDSPHPTAGYVCI